VYGRGHRSPGLGIGPPVTPPIVKNLLIANAVVFVAQFMIRDVTALGAVTPVLFWQGGYIWQPFTYMWLHSPTHMSHLLMNMFVLWMFGSQLAMAWGPKRFLRYYLLCGIGAGFIIATYPYLIDPGGIGVPTLGASGAVYGVLLAYSLTWPDRTIMLIFPPVAFRAIWLIPALFFMSIAFGGTNVSHIGHLGGVVVGWLYLRRTGTTGSLFSLRKLKHRWRRYRMRQRLRAVQYEDHEERRRRRDDHTVH
jgi:membrane associated rhomboid family serine protease